MPAVQALLMGIRSALGPQLRISLSDFKTKVIAWFLASLDGDLFSVAPSTSVLHYLKKNVLCVNGHFAWCYQLASA